MHEIGHNERELFISARAQNFDSAAKIVKLLKEKGLSVSAAESCTGGLIADAITSIAGASKVFAGSLVCYGENIKTNVLGVEESLLKSFGTVSEQASIAMAQSAAKLFKCDFALSTTGYAGESESLSIKGGTIFIALAAHDEIIAKRLELAFSRNLNRLYACNQALTLLLKKLESL